MATNTKNFNFKKPDESDFYSIQDQNGNWDLADEELQKLNEPAFEDYMTGTPVPPAATALEALKSKIKLPVWMSNVVAFCKGCCTLAMIVNNCVSSDADKPLAAAQGKVLQDQLTKLYSDLGNNTKYLRTDNIDNAAKTLWPKIEGSSSYDFTWIPETVGGITVGAKARVIGSYINSEYETQMVLSYLSSAPVVQREKINGSWGEWKVFVTKSDLALLSFTWTGEATNYIDTSITIDGYKPIAITGLNPTGLGTTEALRYFRFNKNNLRAIASFTAKTVTSCVFDVLCIRI